jgi:S1-C subfamily serine protease
MDVSWEEPQNATSPSSPSTAPVIWSQDHCRPGTVEVGSRHRPVWPSISAVRHGGSSRFDRELETPVGILTDSIQTGAPINPGNSGGLADAEAKVIGINTAIASCQVATMASGQCRSGFA